MVTIRTKLTIKELAAPLGVSVGYVYKMRMAGFPMQREGRNLVAPLRGLLVVVGRGEEAERKN